jgi:hypothetical protein
MSKRTVVGLGLVFAAGLLAFTPVAQVPMTERSSLLTPFEEALRPIDAERSPAVAAPKSAASNKVAPTKAAVVVEAVRPSTPPEADGAAGSSPRMINAPAASARAKPTAPPADAVVTRRNMRAPAVTSYALAPAPRMQPAPRTQW